MARAKPDWIMAKALYEKGTSLREISKVVFIDNSNIAKKAKAEGWQRTAELPQLIADGVSVQSRFTALELPQQRVVMDSINKQLAGMDFYQSHARKAVKLGFMALSKNPTESGMKTVLDGMKSGMQVEGLVPFYPNSVVLNNSNTNTQQLAMIKRTYVEADEHRNTDSQDIQAAS